MTRAIKQFTISTKGFTDIIDITANINSIILNSGITEGLATIYAAGSTVSITSIEYEPGLIEDLPELLDKLVPHDVDYKHDMKWHDGNGYAHLRSSIIGNSYTVPIIDRHLELGTWQQVILVDFDNKPRTRKVTVVIS